MAESRRRAVVANGKDIRCAMESCGKLFRPFRTNQRFCSQRCKWRAWDRRHPRAGHPQLGLELEPKREEPTAEDRAREHAPAEEAKKDRGMKASAKQNARYLELAREAAREICVIHNDVDADRVRLHLEAKGVYLTWGNWAGSIFLTKEWKPAETADGSPRFVRCRHKGGRSRLVRVWVRS